jgi:hypothetical protein
MRRIRPPPIVIEGVIVLGSAGRNRPRRSQLDGARGAMRGPAALRGPKGDPGPAAAAGLNSSGGGPPGPQGALGPDLTLRVVAEPLTAACDVSEIMVSAYCADGLGTLSILRTTEQPAKAKPAPSDPGGAEPLGKMEIWRYRRRRRARNLCRAIRSLIPLGAAGTLTGVATLPRALDRARGR